MPNPRSILLLVTTADDGAVVVTPPSGHPRVISGEKAALLFELASDPTQPEHVVEQGVTPEGLLKAVGKAFAGWGAKEG